MYRKGILTLIWLIFFILWTSVASAVTATISGLNRSEFQVHFSAPVSIAKVPLGSIPVSTIDDKERLFNHLGIPTTFAPLWWGKISLSFEKVHIHTQDTLIHIVLPLDIISGHQLLLLDDDRDGQYSTPIDMNALSEYFSSQFDNNRVNWEWVPHGLSLHLFSTFSWGKPDYRNVTAQLRARDSQWKWVTVSFFTYNNVTIPPQYIFQGGYANRPSPDPTWTGYIFRWWCDMPTKIDGKCDTGVIDFTKRTFHVDTQLYALWHTSQHPNTITITFDSQGGSYISSQRIQYGTYAKEPYPNPTRTNYEFLAWCRDALCYSWIVDFSTIRFYTNSTLYASWRYLWSTTPNPPITWPGGPAPYVPIVPVSPQNPTPLPAHPPLTPITPRCVSTITSLTDGRLLGYYQTLGIINQTTDRLLTRAELLKIALHARNIDIHQVHHTYGYRDVARHMWYYPYIQYATEAGIVSGYTDGTFRPNDAISRGEAAKILVWILGLAPRSNSISSFADIAWNDPLGPYIETAYEACLLHGINTINGEVPLGRHRLFGPARPISLGEAVKILYNALH